MDASRSGIVIAFRPLGCGARSSRSRHAFARFAGVAHGGGLATTIEMAAEHGRVRPRHPIGWRAARIGEAESVIVGLLVHAKFCIPAASLLPDLKPRACSPRIGLQDLGGLLRIHRARALLCNGRPNRSECVDLLGAQSRSDQVIDERLELAPLQIVTDGVHKGEFAAGPVIPTGY